MAAPAEASRIPTGPALDNRRVAAALIDLVVPAVLVLAAYAAGLEPTVAVVLVIAGWTLFYFFALETDGGQTLGKRAMGLRATRPDGTPADTRQVAIRTALRVLDHPLGLVVMAVTGDRRLRLGDVAAGTVVTEARAVTDEGTVAATMAPTSVPPAAAAADMASPPVHRPSTSPRPPVAPVPLARPAAVWPPPPVPTAPTPAPPVTDREPVVEPLAEPGWDDEPAFAREPVVEPLAEPRPYDDPAELFTERLRDLGDEDVEEDPPAPASPHERNEPIVKPIETISAIDLVMQDAERRERS